MAIKGPLLVWLGGNVAAGSFPSPPPQNLLCRTPAASCKTNIPTHQWRRAWNQFHPSHSNCVRINYRSAFIFLYRQTDLLPDMNHVGDEFIHHLFGVMRRRWNPHLFRTSGHRRIVDGLDVMVVFTQQDVRQLSSSYRIADLKWKPFWFNCWVQPHDESVESGNCPKQNAPIKVADLQKRGWCEMVCARRKFRLAAASVAGSSRWIDAVCAVGALLPSAERGSSISISERFSINIVLKWIESWNRKSLWLTSMLPAKTVGGSEVVKMNPAA